MPIATRTFRVFVSSTFEDLRDERNALAAPGGPFEELTKVCQRYGARFQAIDLRWGVREEAGHDQRTMEICLGEIERCQQTKIKPNFIILLGDRYGWRPLPARIDAEEFEAVRDRIATASDRRLVEEWYRLDENADPPEYLLKPRTGEFKDKDRWGEVEAPMHKALREVARAAGLSRDALIKYEASATHQEILQGLGKTAEDREHVFAFFCKRSGPNEDPDLGELKRFLREQLKGNVFEPRDTAELCKRVRQALKCVVRTEARKFKSRPALDLEVEAHDGFARDLSRIFLGRGDVLGAIDGYIRGPDRRPMVVHGASGSGKSALMARASTVALDDPGNAVVMRRFIGATPESSSGITLLRSLCQQIGQRYGVTDEIPLEFHSVVRTFADRLALATAEQPFVLFIDALDQIAASDLAAAATWLIPELPPHCRVVVSATEVARSLEKARIFPLQALPAKDAEQVLALWLHDVKRKLQDRQRTKVLDYYNRCGLPLYLKLAFEEARRWRSFDEPDICLLGDGLAGIIDVLFARLASGADHGKVLVGRSLGYLAAARYGLTEDEMLDVLTHDEDVWQEFDAAKRHDPPERRLPVIVWSRLFLDLEPYLTERSAPGGTVVSFYHRQLEEQAAAHFLGGDDRGNRHKSLLTYLTAQPHYLDANNNHPNARKVSELNYQQRCAIRLSEAAATLSDMGFVSAKCAAGLVADLQADYSATIAALPEAQPQLQEEAGFQSESERWTRELIQYASRATRRWMPPRWIASMTPRWVRQALAMRGSTLPRMIESIERWSEDRIAAEIERIRMRPTRLDTLAIFGDFVRSQSYALQQYGAIPGFVSQQAYNSSNSGPIVERAAACVPRTPELRILRRPEFNPLPLELRVLEGHEGNVLGVSITPDGRMAVSASEDQTLRVWDLGTGAGMRILELDTSMIRGVTLISDGRRVAYLQGSQLWMWDLETGENNLCGNLDGMRSDSLSVTADGRRGVSVNTGTHGATLELWDLQRGQRLRVIKPADEAPTCVGVTADGCRAISGSRDGEVRLWDLATGVCLRKLDGHHRTIHSVSVTPDGRRAVSGSEDRTLCVWDLESGACLHTLEGHTDRVNSVSITPDGRQAVSGSHDKTLRVWNLETGKCSHTVEGHVELVSCVSVTADGRRIVSASYDKTIRVWNLERGVRRRSLEQHGARVHSLRLIPGERAVSCSPDTTLRVWDLESGDCLRVLEGHTMDVNSAAATSGGRWLVTGSSDATVRVWDLDTLTCRLTLEGHADSVRSVSVTPAGARAVSGSEDGTLRYWDLKTGNCLRVMKGHTGFVLAVSVMPDGKRVVSGGSDRTLRVWDLENGSCKILSGNRHWVRSVTVRPDGKKVVSGACNRTVRVWDLETELCLGPLPGNENREPNERAGRSKSSVKDPWDPVRGAMLGFVLPDTPFVNTVRLTPDGKRIVSGGLDSRLRIWDLETGACLRVLMGHAGPVLSVGITHDGQRAVSGSQDKTLRVWDLNTGKCLALAYGNAPWTTIEVHGSHRLIAGTESGEVVLLYLQELKS